MRWGNGNESGQGGQATVEWVGLVLGVALALGAVAAGGREAVGGPSGTGLGRVVAQRITCAARDACGAASERGAAAGGRMPRGRRGVRPPARAEAPPVARSDGLWGRGAVGLTKRTWIICLGYRRWRYDVEHPRTPRQAVPIRDTLEIVNQCVNPWSFFFG
jgi:hypothetical protein